MGSYTARELERDTGFGRRTIAYYVQEGLLPRVGRRGPRTRYPELVRDRLLFVRRVREAEAEGRIAPVPLSDLRKLFRHVPPELIASVASGETPVTSDIVWASPAERRSMADRADALRERLAGARPEGASVGLMSFFPRRADEATAREGATAGERVGEAMEKPPPARLKGLAAAVDVDLEAPADAGASEADALPSPEAWAEDRFAERGIAYSRLREPPGAERGMRFRGFRALDELRVNAPRRAKALRRKPSPDAVDVWSQIEITPDIRLSVRGAPDENARFLELAGHLLRQLVRRGAGASESGFRVSERDSGSMESGIGQQTGARAADRDAREHGE